MEKQKEIDVSNNLASLFAELEKAKKEEKPKIVETKKEPDVSTISFLSELDNIAKETEKFALDSSKFLKLTKMK